MSAVHFYLTFNPYLNKNLEAQYTQAHEFHEFLLEQIKSKNSEFAYWGKIIGKDRESKVDLSKMQKVVSDNTELGVSTHLYITDFNHLWVAKVDAVTDKITKKEMNLTLDFYQDKNVEVWFKISDFTLLEFETNETARKLSEFYIDNDYVENRIDGLSPFTTSIRYPTYIQDLAEDNIFDGLPEGERLVVNGHHAINNNSAGQVLRALHAYAFPEQLYQKLPHGAKSEIGLAEMDILENRHHNLGHIAFSYIKALEIILNDLVINHIKRSGFGDEFWVEHLEHPPKLHLEKVNEKCVTFNKFSKNFSIGQLVYFVYRCDKKGNFCFKKAYKDKKPFVNFLIKDLEKILADNQILEIRNLLAHQGFSAISQSDTLAVRNLILGIGCHGLIHKIYQTFYNQEFKNLARIEGDYRPKKAA